MKNKIQDIIDLIDSISLVELNELILLLEKKYNINSNSFNFNQDKKNNNNIEEKINYSVNLLEVGSNKISVIKLIREITELGLKESKNLVESAPVLIKDNLNLSLAESIKKKLEDVGAKIDIK